MIPKHIDVLDGLRGLAALLVVLTHATSKGLVDFYSTGTIGVAIFFCLSGFLMGFLYLGKPATKESIIRYAISRFSRIAPAYLAVIIFSYIIYSHFDSDFIYAINNQNLLRHILFSGNVSVFWSIPPEVQFYIFFILIWLAVNLYLVQHKYAPIIILTAIVICLMLFRNYFPGTFIGSKLHFFIFGCIAGKLRQHIEMPKNHLLPLSQLVMFCITLILGGYLIAIHDYKYPYEIIYYAVITSLAIFLMSFPSKAMSLILANKPLTLLGKWSFSLYLTHEIVMQLVENAFKSKLISQPQALFCAFFGSILLSWLVFELVERTTQSFLKTKLTDLLLSNGKA